MLSSVSAAAGRLARYQSSTTTTTTGTLAASASRTYDERGEARSSEKLASGSLGLLLLLVVAAVASTKCTGPIDLYL